MGELTLPKSGSVYLDANIVIYSVEKIAPYYTILEPMWQASQNGDFGLVSSELLLFFCQALDCFVVPSRKDETPASLRSQ